MKRAYRMVVLKKGFDQANGTMARMIRDNRFNIELCGGLEADSAALFERPADLLLIDLCAQPEQGLALIRRMRIAGLKTEIIAYIARGDARTLKRALRLGVAECLTEPFDVVRFGQAVERFLQRKALLRGEITQDVADRYISGLPRGAEELPKGLHKKTLDLIRGVFNSRPGDSLSCGDVVGTVRLSRITVQRYLAYLSENKELIQKTNYQTGGRPCSLYRQNPAVLLFA